MHNCLIANSFLTSSIYFLNFKYTDKCWPEGWTLQMEKKWDNCAGKREKLNQCSAKFHKLCCLLEHFRVLKTKNQSNGSKSRPCNSCKKESFLTLDLFSKMLLNEIVKFIFMQSHSSKQLSKTHSLFQRRHFRDLLPEHYQQMNIIAKHEYKCV